MAEHVMEHIRLFEIIELIEAADELAGGEAAVGEMIEENFVGHQRGHGDDAPARELFQVVGQQLEIGDAVGDQLEACSKARPEISGSQARPGNTFAWRS